MSSYFIERAELDTVRDAEQKIREPYWTTVSGFFVNATMKCANSASSMPWSLFQVPVL